MEEHIYSPDLDPVQGESSHTLKLSKSHHIINIVIIFIVTIIIAYIIMIFIIMVTVDDGLSQCHQHDIQEAFRIL